MKPMEKEHVYFGRDKMKVGFNSHRLKEGDAFYKKECDFVKEINQMIKYNSNTLAQIVNHPEHKDYLEENEEKIVLSVIQWLGTPIGQEFLTNVKIK